MVGGLTLYVIYRKTQDKPLLRRVTVPAEALRAEPQADAEYGSVLVPLLGTPLDDDIVQTAALLVSGEPTDEAAIDQATIEALWVIEVPMSLPLEARLPDTQFKRAQKALARAKAVGEEYGGVQVATTIRRGRRAGHTIVEEAKRLGVEAIVLGAEEPSRIRGGGRLGGRGGPLENFVGDVTKYVINKAECRVIVTAPPAGEPGEDGAGPNARSERERAAGGESESAPDGDAAGGENASGAQGGSAPAVEPSPSASPGA
jgi:APA family basic amino acid/polyamine antiporter